MTARRKYQLTWIAWLGYATLTVITAVVLATVVHAMPLWIVVTVVPMPLIAPFAGHRLTRLSREMRGTWQ